MTTITEQELVEVMARAIYEKRNGHGCTPWSIRNRAHKDPYICDATAALSAIRAAGWKLTPPPAASHMKGQSND